MALGKMKEGTDFTSKILKRHRQLVDKRQTWDTTWQEILEHVATRKAGITQKDYTPQNGRDSRLYDITALDALERSVAGYMGWTTPKSTPWFRFTPIRQLRNVDAVTRWMTECSRVAQEYMAGSNYYGVRHEYLYDVWALGTGCMFVTVGDDGKTRFERLKPGSYVFETDQYGIANRLSREIELNHEQAEEKFGEDNLPKTIRDCQDSTKRFTFIHCVKPRDTKGMDGTGYSVKQRKAFGSYYIEKESEKLVMEGGFDTFPFTVGRFLSWDGIDPSMSGEWGYGPGFSVLPESRQMNFMAKMMDVSIEKTVFPPLMVPDTYEGTLRTAARAINPYPSGMGPESIFPLQLTGNLEWGMERMKQRAEVIRRRFHLDMFQMFAMNAANNREMTAYEASQLASEKLEAISPAFDRDTTEHIEPMMNRLFGLWAEMGMLPEPPPEAIVSAGPNMVQIPDPQVTLQNRLALALSALDLRNGDEIVQSAIAVAAVQPDILDEVDIGAHLRKRAQILNVDPAIIRTPDQVQAIRQQRAEAQQAQMAAQMLKDGSQAVKNVGGIEQARQLIGA